MKCKMIVSTLVGTLVAGMITVSVAEEHPTAAKAPAAAAKAADVAKCMSAKPQTLCPICGNKINRDASIDVESVRIYLCGKNCPVEKIKADPQAAIAKIRANGEEPCPVSVVCAKCGEFQGSAKCCKADAVKCEKCGLTKGSPGCCHPEVLGKAIFSGAAAAPAAPAPAKTE